MSNMQVQILNLSAGHTGNNPIVSVPVDYWEVSDHFILGTVSRTSTAGPATYVVTAYAETTSGTWTSTGITFIKGASWTANQALANGEAAFSFSIPLTAPATDGVFHCRIVADCGGIQHSVIVQVIS